MQLVGQVAVGICDVLAMFPVRGSQREPQALRCCSRLVSEIDASSGTGRGSGRQ